MLASRSSRGRLGAVASQAGAACRRRPGCRSAACADRGRARRAGRCAGAGFPPWRRCGRFRRQADALPGDRRLVGQRGQGLQLAARRAWPALRTPSTPSRPRMVPSGMKRQRAPGKVLVPCAGRLLMRPRPSARRPRRPRPWCRPSADGGAGSRGIGQVVAARRPGRPRARRCRRPGGRFGQQVRLGGGLAERAAERGDAAQAVDARLGRPALRPHPAGEAAGQHGDDGEHQQRDDVARAADGDVVERRKEEEIPGEEAVAAVTTATRRPPTPAPTTTATR